MEICVNDTDIDGDIRVQDRQWLADQTNAHQELVEVPFVAQNAIHA